MTLAEFLAARLDEESAAAVDAGAGRWKVCGNSVRHADGPPSLNPVASWVFEYAPHNARHDPARVLREVEADRLLLTELAAARLASQQASSICIDTRDSVSVAKYDASVTALHSSWQALLRLARAKAAVYSDHPDYDPAWPPGAAEHGG